jgi:hypothetical protein
VTRGAHLDCRLPRGSWLLPTTRGASYFRLAAPEANRLGELHRLEQQLRAQVTSRGAGLGWFRLQRTVLAGPHNPRRAARLSPSLREHLVDVRLAIGHTHDPRGRLSARFGMGLT